MEAHSFLKSSFPVVLPAYRSAQTIFEHVARQGADKKAAGTDTPEPAKSPFMEAMKRSYATDSEDAAKSRTANGDGTYVDSGEPLVNLFSELEDTVCPTAVQLEDAWNADPEITLKIIWNSRSIHLGKSSRAAFYRSVGWLYKNHPQTLLENLPWLVRPVIQKKAPKPKDETKETAELVKKMEIEDEGEFEMVDAEGEARSAKRARIEEPAGVSEYDVKYGVAHGYWKDLLNILMLASMDQLTLSADMKLISASKQPSKKKDRDWRQGRKKEVTAEQYKKVMKKIRNEPVYAALHMRVAQLFADQLRLDTERLNSGNAADLKMISMAGKWAPSNKATHDTHTFITSTIVELLYPQELFSPDITSREEYLRNARIYYHRKTLAPLRKHIDVVERHLSAETFADIKYNRLPSLAMKQYTDVFLKKDKEHFSAYLQDVAAGKAKISGAILQPATMVAEARQHSKDPLKNLVADGQWNSLVQRIKDAGTLESSIAVCDVSGSMTWPRRPDGSTPMDAAVGMSLLLAEVCKPPFGGGMITFSENPAFIWLEGQKTLQDKVRFICAADWGGSTDFVAVFERLILPHAKKHKVKPEDMVKRVFVFSDMQFNQACHTGWSTSFEKIKKLYTKAGYDMPEMVFWNLAADHVGKQSKAVQAEEPGTALVSGYSQAMMKVFMDGAGFEDAEHPSLEDTVVVDETGKEVKVKAKMTPYTTMLRALSHEAYRMLKVVD